jgi:hypothetical protein
MHYGLPRPTGDLDYLQIVPSHIQPVLQKIAGEGSPLAKKYGLYFQYVALVSLPESYEERLVELLPGQLRNLRLFALEAHDLALSKLTRNIDVDREDVRYLAAAAPLDREVLRARYESELRPIIIGNRETHDNTLQMWIEAFFDKQ